MVGAWGARIKTLKVMSVFTASGVVCRLTQERKLAGKAVANK